MDASILWSLIQKDGTVNIRQQFVDGQGNIYTSDYIAPDGKYDTGARLAKDAAQLGTDLSVQPDLAGAAAQLIQQIRVLNSQLTTVQMQISVQPVLGVASGSIS